MLGLFITVHPGTPDTSMNRKAADVGLVTPTDDGESQEYGKRGNILTWDS